jgi:hypothetical protein
MELFLYFYLKALVRNCDREVACSLEGKIDAGWWCFWKGIIMVNHDKCSRSKFEANSENVTGTKKFQSFLNLRQIQKKGGTEEAHDKLIPPEHFAASGSTGRIGDYIPLPPRVEVGGTH